MLHDVHGEVYGGVEHSQQTVYRADTENGRGRSGRWRGNGRVWDMKLREKGLDGGEDAFLMGHRCTIACEHMGTQQGTFIIFKSMEPRSALLAHL